MWGCRALCSDLQIVGNGRKCGMGGKRGIITTITTFVEWFDMKLLVKCATFSIAIQPFIFLSHPKLCSSAIVMATNMVSRIMIFDWKFSYLLTLFLSTHYSIYLSPNYPTNDNQIIVSEVMIFHNSTIYSPVALFIGN